MATISIDTIDNLTLANLLTFDGHILTSSDAARPDLRVITAVEPGQIIAARGEGDTTPFLALVEDQEAVTAALAAGADDAVVSTRTSEAVARVNALLRRLVSSTLTPQTVTVGDLTLNRDTREVTRADQRITLTRTEFDLLDTLMSASPRVVSRAEITDTMWGSAVRPTSGNAIEVYIGYLRRKTEDLPGGQLPRMIQTTRGVGYTLRESDAAQDAPGAAGTSRPAA